MTVSEYNQCVDKYADSLFRYCVGLVYSSSDADDLVQESFMRLWEHRKKIDQKAAKNWLYKTAYRAMIDRYRKSKRENNFRNDQVERSLDTYQNIEHKDLIMRSLDVLNPTQRNLILLRDYEGYAYKELCELTGMSMTNVKVTLFRSRKKLREEMRKLSSDISKIRRND